jgi:chemotaxis protein methyltransferase CheR
MRIMARAETFSLPTAPTQPLVGTFPITDQEFDAFRELILRETGIFLSDAKRQLVSSRLAKRLRRFGFKTFSQYYDYLMTQDPEGKERLQMINCITTNKTDFFREAHHFTFLREQVCPQWQERARRSGVRRVRVWSAGCSSGEEPYSIAITLKEALGCLTGWDVKVLASDIDTEMLRVGERGIYPAEKLKGVPQEVQHRYFLRGTGEWTGHLQVRPEIRSLVAFRRINLIAEPWPIYTRFDVIFCRNVIIYFNRDTQRRLFERLASYLAQDGYLLVGHSESLYWLGNLFVPLRSTIYRLRAGSTV